MICFGPWLVRMHPCCYSRSQRGRPRLRKAGLFFTFEPERNARSLAFFLFFFHEGLRGTVKGLLCVIIAWSEWAKAMDCCWWWEPFIMVSESALPFTRSLPTETGALCCLCNKALWTIHTNNRNGFFLFRFFEANTHVFGPWYISNDWLIRSAVCICVVAWMLVCISKSRECIRPSFFWTEM